MKDIHELTLDVTKKLSADEDVSDEDAAKAIIHLADCESCQEEVSKIIESDENTNASEKEGVQDD